MKGKKAMGKDPSLSSIITPTFRVSYPNVFEAKANSLNGKLEYSVVALFKEKEDLSALKAAATAAIKAKWGDKVPKKLKSPFRDQGEREKEDGSLPDGYVKGAVFINLKSTRQPGILDQKKQAILTAERFYAGCYARADVSCFAYEFRNEQGIVISTGVSFGLNNLQLVADGEPFSGRRKAEDAFEPIAVAEGSEVSENSDPFGI